MAQRARPRMHVGHIVLEDLSQPRATVVLKVRRVHAAALRAVDQLGAWLCGGACRGGAYFARAEGTESSLIRATRQNQREASTNKRVGSRPLATRATRNVFILAEKLSFWMQANSP